MPNQPKTPAVTFRLSQESIEKVDTMTKALGTTNRSETVRTLINLSQTLANAGKSLNGFSVAMAKGLPDGVTVEAMAEAEVTWEALKAADEASWLNAYMPTEEANRRLLGALSAARPFLVTHAEQEERQRTLRDVLARAEGYGNEMPYLFIAHLKSLLGE